MEAAESPVPTSPAPPESEAAAAAALAAAQARDREERLAREREQLLEAIAARVTDDLKRQVGYVLSLFPDARNSDVTLTLRVWELFYEDELDGDAVPFKALYRLPKFTSIARVRAKIQNEYGLFAASPAVQALRQARDEEVAEEMVADQPGPPMVAIHCDESGKSDRYLVVGSLWIVDVVREAPLFRRLQDWKMKNGITREFKFAELTRATLAPAIAFVQTALADADAMGFKACVVDRQQLRKWSAEETVFRLYYELVMTGITHEVGRGRVVLPRLLSVVKDADDGPDALLLPDLERRLTTTCRDYFNGQVTLDTVTTAKSAESMFVQLADLFSGSVARLVNKTDTTSNQKDEFAAFFETIAGFSFADSLAADQVSDFVYIHRL